MALPWLCRPLVLVLALALLVLGPCASAHSLHLRRRHQPIAAEPRATPARPLDWGQLNILHTSDSHGWLLGHLKSEPPEPNYSADFGDFQSFVLRMKARAMRKGADLLVIDTGDLHDGNGLSDAEPLAHPGTPRGTTCNQYFARVPYDLLTIGNHELYQQNIAQDTHDNFAPLWRGSYLTSNVNITTSGTTKPLGSRFRKFTTPHGRKITAFGILFHFTANANGTVVQPPRQLIKEMWFLEAIQERPDVFILTGHMGISDRDWKAIFDVIRQVHPTVPIIILGGHLHIRDCRQLDKRSMSLASGRYMETIGWLSLSGLEDSSQTPVFSRRYLDANRATFSYHLGPEFDTPEGTQTTKDISLKLVDFNLTFSFGVAPRSYFLNRVPQGSENSLSHLFTGPHGVLSTMVRNPGRPRAPHVVINSGGLRFDVLVGNFTLNDQFITVPFENSFVFVPDVPRQVAERFLPAMNAVAQSSGQRALLSSGKSVFIKAPHLRHGSDPSLGNQPEYHSGTDVEDHFNAWLKLQYLSHPSSSWSSTGSMRDSFEPAEHSEVDQQDDDGDWKHEKTYGYVTRDECPGVGDDTLHIPLPVYEPDTYIGTEIPRDTTSVDVVFLSFFQDLALDVLNEEMDALSAANTLPSSLSSGTSTRSRTMGRFGKNRRRYEVRDLQNFTSIKSNELLGHYGILKWR